MTRRPRSSPVVGLVVLGVLVAAGALIVVIAVAMSDARRAHYLEEGRRTVGHPTGEVVDTDASRRPLGNNWHVVYEYTVDGVRYEALGVENYNVEQLARTQAQRTDEVVVWYLPDDPSDAYITNPVSPY